MNLAVLNNSGSVKLSDSHLSASSGEICASSWQGPSGDWEEYMSARLGPSCALLKCWKGRNSDPWGKGVGGEQGWHWGHNTGRARGLLKYQNLYQMAACACWEVLNCPGGCVHGFSPGWSLGSCALQWCLGEWGDREGMKFATSTNNSVSLWRWTG